MSAWRNRYRGIPDRYLVRSVGVPVAPTLRSPKRGKVGWVERRAKPTVGLAVGRLLMGFAIAQPILRHHSRASRKIHCLAGWGKRTGRPRSGSVSARWARTWP